MSRRDLKALGAGAVDASRRLKLRSGTTARLEELEMGEENENSELVERVQELERKLEMAVDAKDEEIKAKCVELEQCKQKAVLELQEAQKISEELKETLEKERKEAEQ